MQISKTPQFRLLKHGDKIYDIDYENTGRSYTVLAVTNPKEPYSRSGLTYSVHADDIPGPKGFLSIFVRDVNCKEGQYYSSPELAHEAFEEICLEQGFTPVFSM